MRAGHAAIGSNGLNGLGYSFVDGFRAAEQTTVGLEATIIGTFAGNGGLDHTFNTLVGYSAGRGKEDSPGSGTFRTWSGTNNVAVGFGAMQNSLAAMNNVIVGGGASLENESPSAQVIIGASANRLGKVGKESVFIGSGVAYSKGSTGNSDANTRSVHIGFNAAQQATEGSRNTSVGAMSAYNIVTGVDNTHVGYLTGVDDSSAPAASRQIAIGAVARSRVNDTITIGNSILETTAGRTRIGGAAQTSAVIAGVYGSTTADAANLVVLSTGQIVRSTSSGEFKTDIEPLTDEWADKVLELEPVYYRSTCEADNPEWGWYGLVAEDAAQIDPRFASWDRKPVVDGEGNPVIDEFGHQVLEDLPAPNGVPYGRLSVSLLVVIKKQQRQIDDLVARVRALEHS
ncbi:tail fiber domain-containing protein [Devosia sp. A369]